MPWVNCWDISGHAFQQLQKRWRKKCVISWFSSEMCVDKCWIVIFDSRMQRWIKRNRLGGCQGSVPGKNLGSLQWCGFKFYYPLTLLWNLHDITCLLWWLECVSRQNFVNKMKWPSLDLAHKKNCTLDQQFRCTVSREWWIPVTDVYYTVLHCECGEDAAVSWKPWCVFHYWM